MGKQREYSQHKDPTENVILLTQEIRRYHTAMLAAEVRRQDDLRAAETRRVDELRAQRGVYEEKLAKKEAERLNEIRKTDVTAVLTASKEQQAAAHVLAANLLNNDLTQRALVATTALAAAESQSRYAEGQTKISEGITGRLGVLEAARYETVGKSGGIRDTWGWIFGAVMAALAIGGFVFSHWK